MRRLLCCFAALLGLVVGARGTEWTEDFDNALADARASGKYVLIDFSGSDWCGWCKRLDAEVFEKDAFKAFARENLVTVLIDFPRSKPQPAKLKAINQSLAEKYGVSGFPTILLLSPAGDLIGRTGYKPIGSEAYVVHLKEFIDKHKASGLP